MERKKFIINADQRLNEKELGLNVFSFPIAIFSFFKSMADIEAWEKQSSRYNAKRINHPKSDDSRLHWGKVIQWPMSVWNIEDTGIPIVFVGPVLGGPWVAIALEELKVLGLKYAIGIGAYGSFSERLQIDDLVICDNAAVSDGTSKEYSSDSYVQPTQRLLELAEWVFQSENQESKRACTWTTDALYRESVEKMKIWKERGTECVNLETGTFYAVAKELEIESIYFGFILDLIHLEKWTGWGGLYDELKGKVVSMKSNLHLVEDLAVKIAREIKDSDTFKLM
jgi:nucleoside phosphorylase